MPDIHTHLWGPVQTSRFSGEPNRPCTDPDCTVITLDLYLYCQFCHGPIVTTDEPGVYRHIDPDAPDADLAYWDDDHKIVAETGEAPYDEDED